jgi:anti-sigma B factor antagonist
MTESLSIQEDRPHDSIRILRLSGRLDAHGSVTLASRCREACDPERPLLLVLSQIDFLSSSGVGTLLALAEEFRGSNATLLLAAPSEPVSLTVGLLNLGEFLEFHETEESALRRAAA